MTYPGVMVATFDVWLTLTTTPPSPRCPRSPGSPLAEPSDRPRGFRLRRLGSRIAAIKGRSFLLFGLLGALVPIVVVYAIFMRRKVRCPGCGESIWRAAKLCPVAI
jgi:hypothetical protein